VSWQTALGGIPHGLFEDNMRRCSGDHISDPEVVPGVLFLNRAARHNHCDIRDLAPAILNYFGIPKHAAMERESLL
jgi:bisphosphoglycerate-independent phosphoglycerate mutase (AlkP superfamily)